MTIGVPSPSRSGERLVAATPKTVGQLTALGYQVLVQAGAGATATYGDADYEAAGASVVPAAKVWKADIVATVNTPSEAELAKMRQGAALACIMAPQANPDLVTKLNERGLTALALDAVPRISRAQALDVLSTMSNVAGYRAVIEAAEEYGGMFAGQVTAAGKTQPATVFVIGAGVAGLAALGGAVSLGAQVRAFDVRPEVGEQIESMGATFVQAEAAQQEVSSDGYAKELTAEQERMTMQMYAKETAGADVVITTALVRGKGVRTITAEMVANMRPGSVIVDLAASGGGNCELTVPGKRVVSDNGVIILGYTDLCSRMPKHTSQLFGTNVVNLVKLLTPGKKDGQMVLDLEDPVQRGMTVTHDGEVLWPPPPVQVSAAPAAPVVEVEDPEVVAAREAKEAKARMVRNMVSSVIGAGLVVAAVALSPASFVSLFTVFVLAVVVGFYVISGVTHSLHTPLMAQTNAISGIILVGALLQLGSTNWAVLIMSFIAAAIAAINIFGGFLVSFRMLSMFRKEA